MNNLISKSRTEYAQLKSLSRLFQLAVFTDDSDQSSIGQHFAERSCFKCCHCQVHRSLTFDRWLRHVLCYDCPWSPFSHVFEDLDHSPKISDDSPNITARRFYERIKMFPELFLRDYNISEPCRRPQRRNFPNDNIDQTEHSFRARFC